MTRYAVQSLHKGRDEPMFLSRTPRAVNYRRRNQYADTRPRWAWRVQDALTWANRETAEKWAAQMQERADWQDDHHYKSKVGDTVVTVVEVTDA